MSVLIWTKSNKFVGLRKKRLHFYFASPTFSVGSQIEFWPFCFVHFSKKILDDDDDDDIVVSEDSVGFTL